MRLHELQPLFLFLGSAIYFYSLLLMAVVIFLGVLIRRREIANEALSARYRQDIESWMEGGGEIPLSPVPHGQRFVFLLTWTSLFEGASVRQKDHLISVSRKLRLVNDCKNLLNSYGQKRLCGILLAGQLQEVSFLEKLSRFLDARNVWVSLMAFQAILRIGQKKSEIRKASSHLLSRRDWPVDLTARLLATVPCETATEIVIQALEAANAENIPRMASFLVFVDSKKIEPLVRDYLNQSADPETISATLRAVSDGYFLEDIRPLIHHPVWFVRLQAAKALGRIGDPSSEDDLKKLLHDPEQLVGYRAAEALTSLEKMTSRKLSQCLSSLQNTQASEILQSILRERGLV